MRRHFAFASLLSLLVACGDGGHADAGVDAAADAGLDASADAGTDAPVVTCFVDGGFPAPVTGHCRSVITDDAALGRMGSDSDGGFIVPDGRRVTLSAGVRVPLTSGFPMRSLIVPGTHFVVVTDGGIEDEHLIVVDLDTGTVVTDVPFVEGSDHAALFLGMASSGAGATRRLWLSGGGSNHVFAYDLDTATGALTPVTGGDLLVDRPTSMQGYVSGLALLPDGHTIIANLLLGQQIVFLDTTTGTELAALSLGLDYPYDLVLSPDGTKAYVSLWGAHAVQVVDTVARTLGSRITVGKNPEGLALSPDGTTLAVACPADDSFALVDVATRTFRITVSVSSTPLRGSSPSSVAYGADGSLYVTLAGDNAVQVFAPDSGTVGLASAGRVPTMW